MTAQILATKLYIPALRPSSVRRPRLIDRLNMGLNGKLALISAPAGFGKTTLISEWISAGDLQVAWLSLDENDKEPARFLTYIVAALQTIEPEIGLNILNLLELPQPPPIDSLLTLLLNDLAAMPHEFVMVLDDYHVLGTTEIDSMLTYLIDNQPPQMHLVITTREDPRLPLARLRVRGQLTELRAADLRFTADEAAAFLSSTMGLNLSTKDIAALEQRTEGWIAGLQLAAISMRGQTNPHQFVASFTGSHRFIVDYLVEEVLNRQSASVRDFLFQTSILDRLSASLCDAVTGRNDGQAMLQQLEQGNMLIIPLDDERRWYRYHHLFADVLRAYARSEYPDGASTWLSRASQWHDQHGLRPDAIQYALDARDFEQAANLIELSWPFIQQNIQPSEWLRWAEMLPDEIVEARPVLTCAFAWALLDKSDLDTADSYLTKVENWLETADVQLDDEVIVVNHAQFASLAGTTATARAYLSQAREDVEATIHHAQRALTLLAQDQHYWRGLTALFLGLAEWAKGDLDDAHEAIIDSIQSLYEADNLYFQVYGTVVLAEISVLQGKLRQAHDRYNKAIKQAQSVEEGRTIPMSISLYVGLGNLYCEWDEIETAEQTINTGLQQLHQALMSFATYRLTIALARIRAAEGNFEAALNLLSDASEDIKASPQPDMYPPESLRTRFLLRQGRLDEALDWVQQRELSIKDPLSFGKEFDHITLARIKLAQYQRQPDDQGLEGLLDFLEQLRHAAIAGGRVGRVLEILVLQALAYQALGNMSEALRCLHDALTLAEPEGYVRIFVDEGQAMRDLLSVSLTDGANIRYIMRLLQHMGSADETEGTSLSANELLIEPLSDREMEVLEIVAQGLTNQAIADDLFIAVSTVKKHINNILGKLGVENRIQAVSRARDLGILS